jgi:hypothetical protein
MAKKMANGAHMYGTVRSLAGAVEVRGDGIQRPAGRGTRDDPASHTGWYPTPQP